MEIGYQVHKSELIVIGVFLAVGGLGLLFMIDFTWGILSLFGAVACFSQAHVRGEKGAVPDKNSVADD